MNQLEQVKEALEKAKRICDHNEPDDPCIWETRNVLASKLIANCIETLRTMLSAKMRSAESYMEHNLALFDVETIQSEAFAAGLAAQGKWQPIESAPKDGNCLVAVNTDEGYTIAVLDRDEKGDWLNDGEPTFCHSYYFEPKYWHSLPSPPQKEGL